MCRGRKCPWRRKQLVLPGAYGHFMHSWDVRFKAERHKIPSLQPFLFQRKTEKNLIKQGTNFTLTASIFLLIWHYTTKHLMVDLSPSRREVWGCSKLPQSPLELSLTWLDVSHLCDQGILLQYKSGNCLDIAKLLFIFGRLNVYVNYDKI